MKNELESLIEKAIANGAAVTLKHDDNGFIESVQIVGLKGIGGFVMAPISATEKLRGLV